MAKCPHCANTTQTYTDPQLQVRCTVCFNHMDGTAGTPIGRMIDTTAPITIVLANGTTKTYATA